MPLHSAMKIPRLFLDITGMNIYIYCMCLSQSKILFKNFIGKIDTYYRQWRLNDSSNMQ